MYPRRELQDADYKIGTSVDALLPLRRLGVPAPDISVGSPASAYYVRADGTRVGDGYATATWVYDVISRVALTRLLKPLCDDEWAYVYVKTNFDDGSVMLPRQAFGVYYGIMYRPILTGQEGQPISRTLAAYQSVKVQFIDLVYQPGYL